MCKKKKIYLNIDIKGGLSGFPIFGPHYEAAQVKTGNLLHDNPQGISVPHVVICKLALILLAQAPAGVRACATVQVICLRTFSGLSQVSTAPTEVCAAAFSPLLLCRLAQLRLHALHSPFCITDLKLPRLDPVSSLLTPSIHIHTIALGYCYY